MLFNRRPRANLGVTVCYRKDRPVSPYGVQRRCGGKCESLYFADEVERDRKAEEWRDAVRRGIISIIPTNQEIWQYRSFKAAIGSDDWRDVVAYWRERGSRGTSMSVAQMVDAYAKSQETKVRANKLDELTKERHLKIARAFVDAFGAVRVGTLDLRALEKWLDALGHDSPHTYNSYLKTLRAMWNAAEISPNLPKKISVRNSIPEEVKILSVDDARRRFTYGLVHLPWFMPRLAAEAFVGLRYSSAVRMEKMDVNFLDRGILLPAKKLKTGMRTGRRHYIDGLPDNFWEWMELATEKTWSLTPRIYLKRKSELFVAAGVPHPKNCLRHSACTYHVAAFKDPGKTATMLCHTSQQLLWSNYNGRATRADGVAYFSITPASLSQG